MAQKPVLRGEVGCACVAREVSVGMPRASKEEPALSQLCLMATAKSRALAALKDALAECTLVGYATIAAFLEPTISWL